MDSKETNGAAIDPQEDETVSTDATVEEAATEDTAKETAPEPETAVEVAEGEAVDAEAGAAEVEAEPKPEPKRKKPAKTKKSKAAAKKAKKKTPAKSKTKAVVPEGDGEEAEVKESKYPMKWFVIHTYSGHENKVKENITKMISASAIEDQFGRLIVPTEEVAEMKKGKKTVTTRKFFPSYILIEMYMSDDSWHLVNGIPGVTSFVGTATKPQPLLQPEVERILGRMDKDKESVVPEIPYTLGEHIRIKDGPFSDFTGVVDEINAEKGKLRVLVSIFGRETPVELDFLQVESI